MIYGFLKCLLFLPLNYVDPKLSIELDTYRDEKGITEQDIREERKAFQKTLDDKNFQRRFLTMLEQLNQSGIIS